MSIKKLIFLFVSLLLPIAACDSGGSGDASKKVKHVILFIGDGMGYNSEVAGSRYLTGTDNGLSFHSFDYKANVTTWDADTYGKYKATSEGWVPEAGASSSDITDYLVSLYDPENVNPYYGYNPVTGGTKPYPLMDTPADDYFTNKLYGKIPATGSASSATALATGKKTQYHNLSWLIGDPADGELVTIAEKLRDQKGYSLGCISTVPFNHATPAAFVAHNPERENWSSDSNYFGDRFIAEDMIRNAKPEVVIAAGQNPFDASAQGGGIVTYLPDDLKTELMADTEYQFVERIDGQDGAANLLAAADSAIAAGKKLWALFGGENNPLGNMFDHYVPSDTPGSPAFTRANDEDPTLADAVNAALKVLSQDEDGFFAIIEQGDIDWANHIANYSHMVGSVYDLHKAVEAAAAYVDQEGDSITWENTIILVTADHNNGYIRFDPNNTLASGDLPTQSYDPSFMYGMIPQYPDGEVSYEYGMPVEHTNELVRLYGKGARVDELDVYKGSWYPGTDILDNTQINHFIQDITGVK